MLRNTSSHLYRIAVENNKSALVHMREKGVVCGIHYDAAHQNKVYNKQIIHCPNSAFVAETTLSIPFNEKLTKNEVNHIVDCVREIQ